MYMYILTMLITSHLSLRKCGSLVTWNPAKTPYTCTIVCVRLKVSIYHLATELLLANASLTDQINILISFKQVGFYLFYMHFQIYTYFHSKSKMIWSISKVRLCDTEIRLLCVFVPYVERISDLLPTTLLPPTSQPCLPKILVYFLFNIA